jgi:hypothetical protein
MASFYNKKPSYTDAYQYNGNGKDNTLTFYNKDNKVSFTEQRFYDDKVRLFHELSHNASGKFLMERSTTYDAHGNEIKNREASNIVNLTWEKQYTYDKHGNWTYRHTYPTEGKGSEDFVTRTISYY